jgi:hypothetical protein
MKEKHSIWHKNLKSEEYSRPFLKGGEKLNQRRTNHGKAK